MSPWVNIVVQLPSSQGLHVINYKLAQDEGADISTAHHKEIRISSEKLSGRAYWGATTIWKIRHWNRTNWYLTAAQ